MTGKTLVQSLPGATRAPMSLAPAVHLAKHFGVSSQLSLRCRLDRLRGWLRSTHSRQLLREVDSWCLQSRVL